MRRLSVAGVVAVCGWILSGACAADGATGVEPNPSPAAYTASPNFFLVGSADATVIVRGKYFVGSSQARLGGVDRPTTVLTDSTLSVTLFAADLALAATPGITVVNPPPGGGVSGPVSINIGYPTPIVTAVEPAGALVGESVAELVVRGSGFVAQSVIQIDGAAVATTVESDTVLRTTQTAALRSTAGASIVRVLNPQPVGASVISGTFLRSNPRPRTYAAAPDSVFRGAFPVNVTVTGEHYPTGAQVFVNGALRTSTRLSSTAIRVSLLATDVATTGLKPVFVVVSGPGGGASDTVSVRVVVPPPRVSALVPASAAVGSGDIALQVRGADFLADAVVHWNGAPRVTTFVNDSVLTVALPASDFAAAGAGQVVVRIPSRGSESFAATLPILAPGLSVGAPIVVNLANRALASDPVRNAVYASVPASSGNYPNAVVKIDPLTGNVVDDVFVGSEPEALAISDDGAFLYVGLLGASQVTRIDLTTFEIDGQLLLPSAGFLGANRAEDIVVLPGQPQRVAVSLRNTCCSPRHSGVVLFSGTTLLPLRTQGHTGSNRIVAGPDASVLYGYNNETTEFGFRRIAVSDSGLTEVQAQQLFSNFGLDIESGGSYVYSTSGAVVSVATFSLHGSLAVSGPVRPDATRGRVHVLASENAIHTFHYATLQPLGTATVDGAGLSSIVQWGTDGIALGRGNRIVLLRGSLIGP